MGRLEDMAAKVARSVSALADDVFTVRTERPIRFKPEGGTVNSLANAKAIREAGYEFVKATMIYDNVRGDWKLEAFFRRENDPVSVHVFGGLNFGYGGQGPRGLLEFGEIFGIVLDPNKVTSNEYKQSMPPRGAADLEMVFG